MSRTILALGLATLVPLISIQAQSPREQPHGQLDRECSECHSSERWNDVSKASKFKHETTGFKLEGAHAGASCRACHASLVFNHVGTACADCHEDAHRGELGSQCDACHLPASWTNQTQMLQVHNRTRLPLFATHARLDCTSCHRNQRPYQYKNTPAECGNCHVSTYLATTSPSHVTAGFSRKCEDCHSVTAAAWSTSVFSHPATFPLSGAHAGVTCARCHGAGRPQAVGSGCASCHETAFAAAANPSHTAGGFPRTCEDCHTVVAWRPAKFDHSATRFPLTGLHTGVQCASCHVGGRYAGTPSACNSCHQADYARTTNPNHAAGRFSTQCQDCHNTNAWRPANFDHQKTRFALTGAHERTPCASCHAGGRYTGTPSDCNSCHQPDYARTTNPNHPAGGFPTTCQTCHSTRAWRPASVDHSRTRFPLTGVHARTDCARCHTGGRYTGTPTDCNSCHQPDYARTTNPNHAAGGFSTACQTCHGTSAWRPASLDHSRTRFPLTGAHARVDCARCHTGGRYTGTPTDCNSCHQPDYARTTNPNHSAGGFPTTCQSCHSTNAWRPATVDHSRTRFPLTGAHTRVSCDSCHPGGRYTGTATACSGCHQSNYQRTTNPNHVAAGFPTSCETCHSTSAWRPSSWDHDGRYFPIYSGKHRGKWSRCSDCHVTAGNYRAFECILCHEHSNRSEMDDKHRGRTGYAYQSAACYRCHPRGTKD
jgi:nitrate/TMAO reductase-like tetraheme cytochrome c subunit